MTKKDNTLLNQIDDLLKQLVGVGKRLCAASQEAIAPEEVGELQDQQNELIEEIKLLDEQLSKHYKEGEVKERFSKQWSGITKKLKTFQELNEQFINNLTVRKELIGFEVKDIKKQRRDLSKVKESYLGTGRAAAKKKSRINTVT